MKKNKKFETRALHFGDDLYDLYIWWDILRHSLMKKDHKWIEEFLLKQGVGFLKQFLPQKTKVMSRAFLKDIIDTKETRLLILIAHLYLENFLDEIIKNRVKRPNNILNFRYLSAKLNIIYSFGILDEQLYKEILFFNTLRNKYSHDLTFDILDANFNDSPILKELYKLKKCRNKKMTRNFYDFLLRFHLIGLLYVMETNFRELMLLDIKKK